ncbi:MAG: cell division protein SepF [Bowdeniella nasicola]|nr:cell division protein SepF [Bowdeniella nasicola]
MSGVIKKTMKYLALAQPEDEYEGEDYEVYEDEAYEEEHNAPQAEVTPITRAASAAGRFEAGPELSRIRTFHPTAFNEAKPIGTAFREGIPVILNLAGMSEADSKRMIDFCSGVAYGLDGTIERVTRGVFLLSPATVEVQSGDDDSDLTSHLG